MVLLARSASGEVAVMQNMDYLNAACGACLRTFHYNGTGWSCEDCGAFVREPDGWGKTSVRLFWDGDGVIFNGMIPWIAEWLRVPEESVYIGFDRSVDLLVR